MKEEKIQDLRNDYKSGKLEIQDLSPDPIKLFEEWFEHYLKLEIHETNAMTLATVNKENQPSARTVLLKEYSNQGFVFYSNYQSQKAQDLEINPNAALLFFWKESEQQIRIEGVVEKLSIEESRKYFQSRPKGSQLGAWASPQSKIIADRDALDDRLEELSNIYKDHDVLPLPANWGGYILRPNKFEFWKGRENRLHDRFQYRLIEDNKWKIDRLAP